MNKVVVGLIAGLALGTGATWIALHPAAGPEPAKSEAAAAKPKEKENPLQLTAAKRAAAGITLAKPATANLTPEVNAFGRVLDPAPLVALLTELEAAQVSLVASQKAADRATELFAAGNNASAQSVETAQAAAARDLVAVSSARARLTAGWGRNFTAQNSKTVFASLEAGAALIRLDLLPGETPAAATKLAQVRTAGGTEVIAAEIIGPAPVADAQVQGESFLAIIRGRTLPSGAALRATLAGRGEAATALLVPRDAIVYHQGSAWIYVLDEEDTFERKLVTLGRALGNQIAVLSGIDEGHQIVVSGAGQMLSAELQAGGAPEEK